MDTRTEVDWEKFEGRWFWDHATNQPGRFLGRDTDGLFQCRLESGAVWSHDTMDTGTVRDDYEWWTREQTKYSRGDNLLYAAGRQIDPTHNYYYYATAAKLNAELPPWVIKRPRCAEVKACTPQPVCCHHTPVVDVEVPQSARGKDILINEMLMGVRAVPSHPAVADTYHSARRVLQQHITQAHATYLRTARELPLCKLHNTVPTVQWEVTSAFTAQGYLICSGVKQ